MKKFWSLLNAVLFLVCSIGFVLAGIAGATVPVLLTVGVVLVLWALMMIMSRMRRPQEQVYYVPPEEEDIPFDASWMHEVKKGGW